MSLSNKNSNTSFSCRNMTGALIVGINSGAIVTKAFESGVDVGSVAPAVFGVGMGLFFAFEKSCRNSDSQASNENASTPNP